jgi:hypothetical protein
LDDRKANALIKVVNDDLKKGNQACLRMINDQYRKTIYKAATFATAGAMTAKQAVDMATKDFLNAGFNVIEYKDGRRVNISSYSQMAVRTASQRAMLMGEGEFRKEIGETLVIISKHGTSCELCQPHEGKVYVDDVYSKGKPDKKHKLLSEAMEQGLFHPNCRHGVNTYYDLDGIDEAAPIDKVPVDNDNPETSRIDVQMQREQRKIAGFQSPDNIKKARTKLNELEAEKEKVIFEFKPAATIEEAEEYAKRFVKGGFNRTGKDISYSGISIENANEINKTLTEIFYNTQIDKFSSIEVFGKKNKKIWQSTGDAPMACSNFGNLMINKELCKDKKAIDNYIKEGKEAFDLVINNIDKLSGNKLEMALRYKEAGRTTVGKGIKNMIIHETGHHISWMKEYSKMFEEVALKTNWKEYAKKISGYATSKFAEYIAESWNAYYIGEKDILQKEMIKIFDKVMKNG